MRECFALLLQLFLLAISKVVALQFLKLEAQEVFVGAVFLNTLLQAVKLLPALVLAGVQRIKLATQRAVVGYNVHYAQHEVVFLQQ